MEIITRRKKFTAGIIISICALLLAYFAVSIYFMKHLFLGTKINGTDVSFQTVDQIKSEMASELQKYTLTINERDGKREQISAGDINLKYKSDEKIKSFKDGQNPLEWASSFFNTKSTKMVLETTFDKQLLEKKIDNLNCLNNNNVVEPKEPSISYGDNAFVIINEVKGNKLDKDIFVKIVTSAVTNGESTVDLESANCYISPKYTSKSKKVIDAKDMLNKYISSKVTYTFGDAKKILDKSTINQWVSVDDNYNVSLDDEKVQDYVLSLAYAYNTNGVTRDFHTSSGNTVSISGGDYGWQINVYKEAQDLSENIKEGKTITKEPIYLQSAASHDGANVGNTYVEIDLTKQHLWFYKNGSLVVQGDIVTGNVSLNDATPPGIYRLKDRERNATLKGQDYATVVSYWMPFNLGIGLHDATWRSEFGGQIYQTNGSHGCVNLPYSLAETIFENIEIGTPIVCYN